MFVLGDSGQGLLAQYLISREFEVYARKRARRFRDGYGHVVESEDVVQDMRLAAWEKADRLEACFSEEWSKGALRHQAWRPCDDMTVGLGLV